MTAVPDLVDRIDDLLPQMQCTRCGYASCRPYAEAIVAGAADINRCPPGGEAMLVALARIVERDPPALDTKRGLPGPLRVARIDAKACIGCTLCIKACPIDAIIGAPKRLHDVLSSLCSGCGLCVDPCPVDCITMDDAGREWTYTDASAARMRYDARGRRLLSDARAAARAAEARKRKTAVAAALARARARRATALG